MLKRVWLVAVLGLVAGGGCKKSSVPAAPTDMVRTSADGMLSSDGRGVVNGGEVEVAGLIKALHEEGGRLVVTFASKQPTRSVLCRVEAGQVAAAGNLAVGQLVAMHGLARGSRAAIPCSSRAGWSGPGLRPGRSPRTAGTCCARPAPWRCAGCPWSSTACDAGAARCRTASP